MDTAVALEQIELTILMPCLNEAETLATCIRKARGFLDRSGISGEVVIADNGSTDGSREIATREGARVVPAEVRGYGAALISGIESARGRYVIMADADDSYDFANLDGFVEKLRQGYELVMGNRFRGGVAAGAMPWHHKYIGNPVLSFLGRLLFPSPIGDFHCGLRGFDRNAIRSLKLTTPGMEFASEMVVKASLAGLKLVEVPTTLSPDGRSRPPHLRSFRDGWRHLRFLLLHSPRWLFLYPSVALAAVGGVGVVLLLPGARSIVGVTFDTSTFIASCLAVLIGTQGVTMAAIARRAAGRSGLLPRKHGWSHRVLESVSLEGLLLTALAIVVLGCVGLIGCFIAWAQVGFGDLQYDIIARLVTLSLTAIAVAIQLAFAAFLMSALDLSAD
jgi:hypothetical protein